MRTLVTFTKRDVMLPHAGMGIVAYVPMHWGRSSRSVLPISPSGEVLASAAPKSSASRAKATLQGTPSCAKIQQRPLTRAVCPHAPGQELIGGAPACAAVVGRRGRAPGPARSCEDNRMHRCMMPHVRSSGWPLIPSQAAGWRSGCISGQPTRSPGARRPAGRWA